VARREADGFADAVPLDTINTIRPEEVPTPSADGLAVYYVRRDLASDPEQKGLDIWVATRLDTTADFGNPRRIQELSKPGSDAPSWISPDNCRLYFASDREGDPDLFVASRRQE
jgi:Tol biopolymer transport system component